MMLRKMCRIEGMVVPRMCASRRGGCRDITVCIDFSARPSCVKHTRRVDRSGVAATHRRQSSPQITQIIVIVEHQRFINWIWNIMEHSALTQIIRDVLAPHRFAVRPPMKLAWEELVDELLYWEIYQGRLLGQSMTREQRRFRS